MKISHGYYLLLSLTAGSQPGPSFHGSRLGKEAFFVLYLAISQMPGKWVKPCILGENIQYFSGEKKGGQDGNNLFAAGKCSQTRRGLFAGSEGKRRGPRVMISGQVAWDVQGGGAFPAIRRGCSDRFEAPPDTPVLSASYCPSFFMGIGKPSRGSRGLSRCDHYLLKSCIPAIKVDSTLTGSYT